MLACPKIQLDIEFSLKIVILKICYGLKTHPIQSRNIEIKMCLFEIPQCWKDAFRHEIATTLREAKLLNGILTNADVWYSLQKNEIAELEEVDRMLLRRILGAPDSTCVESLYLELGVIPIHIILKSHWIKYLHYLATQPEGSMLYEVFISQWK